MGIYVFCVFVPTQRGILFSNTEKLKNISITYFSVNILIASVNTGTVIEEEVIKSMQSSLCIIIR